MKAKKTTRIMLRLSEKEKAEMKKRAEENALGLSTWIRMVALRAARG